MSDELQYWGSTAWGDGFWAGDTLVGYFTHMGRNVLTYDPTTTDTKNSESISYNLDSGTFHFINQNGVAIDYTLEGTYDGDDAFSDAVQIASGTLAANDTTSESVSTPWDQIRVTATPQTTPSADAIFMVKLHQGR